jgi:hypothetical protein
MRPLSLLLLLSFFLCASNTARAAGPVWPIGDIPRFWILGEGNNHFSLDGTFFRTEENYDASGHPFAVPTMDHVNYLQTRLHAGFGFTPRISIFAQANVHSIFVTNAANSNLSDDSNLGLGDASFAFRWLLWRSRSVDRVYPTEWAPKSLAVLLEGSWLFPMYDTAKGGKPPLGDQSNDFSTIMRGVWYANEWFALSGSLGYIYRTAGYAPQLPWNIRLDLTFLRNQRLRFWLDLLSEETTDKSGPTFNPKQPDPIPGGSLLFKSEEPTIRRSTFGVGYLLTREWEIALGGMVTASGVNHAKGMGAMLGFTWRPYQVKEINYEAYRKEERLRAIREPEILKRQVLRYGFKATILRVSVRGNFFKIGFGSTEGVQVGDTFQVYEPDDFTQRERSPIAVAKVVAIRPNSSFLRVESRYSPESPQAEEIKIVPGYEAQRVDLDE